MTGAFPPATALREPNDIASYTALACIAIQANQNEMHGGQSVPNFDYSMAQGVDKTYSKEYFKALIQFIQLEKGMPYDQVKALVDNVKENLGSGSTWTRPRNLPGSLWTTCPGISGRRLQPAPRGSTEWAMWRCTRAFPATSWGRPHLLT